jgi:hypothetical protein
MRLTLERPSGLGQWDRAMPAKTALALSFAWCVSLLLARPGDAAPARQTGAPPPATASPPAGLEHVVVFHRPGVFAAWPANGGLWSWDDGQEVLVGFCTGDAQEQPGHNIVPPYTNRLARTRDGGLSWRVEQPEGYGQEGAKFADPPAQGFRSSPRLALRCTAIGYHGGDDPRGGFLFSDDRGHRWQGPFHFTGLADAPELRGWEMTARTDYLLSGDNDGLFLLSARQPNQAGTDRVFCARTRDSGRRFEFLGWVIGPDDPHRAVMPATVRCTADRLVTVVRRRQRGADRNWIDALGSDDGGRTWRSLGRVGDTGKGNGNPPALIRLRDGRLCCAYGNRDRRQIVARLSADDGRNWAEEVVLRDGYRPDHHGDADLGYPRLFQRRDDRVVAVYYWSAPAGPETIIAATHWPPPAR